jgi:hypothetical protein
MIHKMESIQKFKAGEEGYHPFLIREGWQVAQLNYTPDQDVHNIDRVEVHRHTDEVFVLLKGQAVLIGAGFDGGPPEYQFHLMEQGVTYNIAMNAWHNIAMLPGSEVLIVESADTHIRDVEYRTLTDNQKEDLYREVSKLLPAT